MMIYCTECGKEVSDKAATCPNCGCPMSVQPVAIQPEAAVPAGKKKDSGLSIASCVCTGISVFAFNWLALIGIILGLIDLGINNKKERHVGSIFGVVIGVIVMIAYVSYVNSLMHSF